MQPLSTSTPTIDPPGREPSGHQAVVLIVDDYPDCRDMYAAFLSLAGFRVLKANDGYEAIEAAARWLPDVVLMDLSLPGIDGCEATRRLKANPRTGHIPVVALTAQSLPRLETLSALGFEDVLIKPCLPDELAEEVARVVHDARLRGRRG